MLSLSIRTRNDLHRSTPSYLSFRRIQRKILSQNILLYNNTKSTLIRWSLSQDNYSCDKDPSPALEHQMKNEAEIMHSSKIGQKCWVEIFITWFCLRTRRELISLAFSISMLLSMLICLYFLLVPVWRKEFCRRGRRSKL